jgi:mono/diheme cytochrome c family protein
MKSLLLHSSVALLLLAGCSKPASTDRSLTPQHYAAQIVEVSGGKQVAGVGSQLPDPVVVQVNGADGNAVAGAGVSFRGEGLNFNPAQALSDSSGQVTSTVRLGSAPRDYQIIVETPKSGVGGTLLNIRETALGYEQKLGKEMNDKYCVRCHDPESTPERVSNLDNLSPKPHPFAEGAVLNLLHDSDLTNIISRGGTAAGKSAQMPAWGATLKAAEIKALISYIRAIADPPYQASEGKRGKE